MSKSVTAIELSNHHDIVNAFTMHYSLISVKAELDQMVKGLRMYGVYELIQANKQLMRQLFVHFKPLTFTADMLFDMFPAKFSPVGSNAREAEEAALMNWVNYTQEIEGKSAIYRPTRQYVCRIWSALKFRHLLDLLLLDYSYVAIHH